ncbi:MAG: polysaccharide deacetylase family protein, partial [Proteobacteria bacterium]|nr:polysaccharide deacetylase family protein [Pseudomonadota bacterium]
MAVQPWLRRLLRRGTLCVSASVAGGVLAYSSPHLERDAALRLGSLLVPVTELAGGNVVARLGGASNGELSPPEIPRPVSRPLPKAKPAPLAPAPKTSGAAAAPPQAAIAPETPPTPRQDELTPLESRLGAQFKNGLTITGSTPHRLILFTFDDGPDRRTTPKLLERLDQAHVRAVFFITSGRIQGRTQRERDQQRIAKDIAKRGHMIASHTVDHLQLPLLNDRQVLAQVQRSEDIFSRIFGDRPWLFRPPGGARSKRVDRLLARRGYTTVLWNLGAGDFQVRTARQVFHTWLRVFERRKRENGDRGGIVLLHDTYPWSVDAFDLIVAHLQRRNCRLLEQGEQLYDVVDDIGLFYRARGDENASTLAPPAHPQESVLASRQAKLRKATAARCQGSPRDRHQALKPVNA